MTSENKRLNPQTTPHHQLRAAKAQRNRDAALAEFVAKKAEIDAMLARLQDASADHFGVMPDEMNWSQVEGLTGVASALKHITDSVFREGEFAD